MRPPSKTIEIGFILFYLFLKECFAFYCFYFSKSDIDFFILELVDFLETIVKVNNLKLYKRIREILGLYSP